MEKDFISIAGQEYRVEANWNAIADFCRRKGVSDLGQLDILAKIAVDDILPLMHCCLKEGERMEGRELGLSEIGLGELVSTVKMGEFMRIYARQSNPGLKSGSSKKK